MSKPPYDSAFFSQQVARSLSSARVVLNSYFQYHKPKSIVDVGCGLGPWLKAAMELGVNDVLGMDGDYVDRETLLIPKASFRPTDLRERISLDRRFDLAISAEVAEHLPYERSETFIRDLTALSDMVLFSAALPYQGGTDHINEQWLEFWAVLFERQGYVPVDLLRQQLWSDQAVEFWYSQNLVIFCPADVAAKTFPRESLAAGRPLSYPHPLTFLVNAARYRPLLSTSALNLENEDYQDLLRAYQKGDGRLPVVRMADATDDSGSPLFPMSRMLIVDPRVEIAARDTEAARLAGELKSARSEVGRLGLLFAARDTEVARLGGELESARSEAGRLGLLFAARDTEVARLGGELESARSEVGRLGLLFAARDTEVARLGGELESARSEAGRLGPLFAARDTEIEHVQSLLVEQIKDAGRLRAELAASIATHHRTGVEVERLKAELERVGSAAAAQKQAAAERLRQSEYDFAVKNKRIHELERELGDTSHRFRRSATELQESRNAIQALQQSWSWRITAPLRWFVEAGVATGRLLRGDGRDQSLRAKVLGWMQYIWFGKEVRESGLFDNQYYLEHNPDVAESKMDPMRHFFVFGASELRNPHPLFDLHYYFTQNRDVAASNINPLVHFLRWGAEEGRNPHPDFHTAYYLECNPIVAKIRINPLVHFMRAGAAQGLRPNPWFDTVEYLEHNPHVALKGQNPLVHHLNHRNEQRERAAEARENETQTSAPVAPEAPALPLGMRIDPRTTELRISLRDSYRSAGLPPLNDAFHSDPMVTVIIPCYNYGYYLEDALLSAMTACSYPMEIIVVDDGSTDEDSIAAVRELVDRYGFLLLRQPNTGQSGARYNGIRNSRGKFIQFLDADDLLTPGKIDAQLKMMLGDATIDIAVCEYELCDADGHGRRTVKPSTLAGFNFSAEDFLVRWERGFSLPIHCALFRREVLDRDQFQCITKAGKEDWIFWIVIAASSPRFVFRPDVMATYRIHGHNTYTNREGMGLDFLRACLYVTQAGLNHSDNFLEESIAHFQKAYLGSIKHEAIVWARSEGSQ